MKFKAEIDVMPLDALLDPQGKAVSQSMDNLDYLKFLMFVLESTSVYLLKLVQKKRLLLKLMMLVKSF